MSPFTLAASTTALIGSIAGGVWALEARMDSKYVPLQQFDQFYINDLQQQIRELERDIRSEPDPRVREKLQYDLDRLLDQYCLKVNDPRRCGAR